MARKLSDDPKNVARRAKRAASKIQAKATAALETLNKELGSMSDSSPTKPDDKTVSPDSIRRAWGNKDVFKLEGQHHPFTAKEAYEVYMAIGGSDFSDANESNMGMISHGGTFLIACMKPNYKMDGHKVGCIDFLPVGEDAYDVRICGAPEDIDNIPDVDFIGGVRIIRTIKNVQLNALRATLMDNGIKTDVDMLEAAQGVIDMCIEHTTKCDCEGCTEIVARAKKEGRDLIELIAEDSPVVKMALDVVKEGGVRTADKTAAPTGSTPEPLSSIVEGIKRAALAGAEADEQTQERVREAFKRSFVVVPDKQTVN